MFLARLIFTWIGDTLINKTTASSAVGSGSVIFVMFSAVNDKISAVDMKADMIKSEVVRYVDEKHGDVILELDLLVRTVNEGNKKLDKLDDRVYQLNQTIRGGR